MRSHIGRHDLGHFLPASSPTTYLSGVANRTGIIMDSPVLTSLWNNDTIWIEAPNSHPAHHPQCYHIYLIAESQMWPKRTHRIALDCFHHAWRYNYLVVCLSVSDNYFYYPYVEVSMVYGINAFNCEDLQETRISMLSAYIYCPAVSDQR
jgi:hypothetical protein